MSLSASLFGISEIERLAGSWVLDGAYRRLSPRTTDTRKRRMRQFIWWLRKTGAQNVDASVIKAFLVYVAEAQPEGRWGNPLETDPSRPLTTRTWFGLLRTFFRWIEAEGMLPDGAVNPIARVKAPMARQDAIVPFSDEHLTALLDAARKTRRAVRDEAILLMLVDTGLRAQEFCDLTLARVDLAMRRIQVRGKGDKIRIVYYGPHAGRALLRYLRQQPREEDAPLFQTDRKVAFTPSSLRQLFERLGQAAGIKAVRCSPHTCRHTFAVSFLRNGGNVFALRDLLGHTTLVITQRYLALAQADLQQQHTDYSPVEHLLGPGRRR